MADEGKVISSALRAVLDMHTAKGAARGATRKAMVTADAMRTLTRNPRDFKKLVDEALALAESFMAKSRERRKALQLALLEQERALCSSVTRANAQPPPVLTSRNDRKVNAAKNAAAAESERLVEAARKRGSASAKNADSLRTAINELYNLGIDEKASAKLGYFLGRRQVSATASAAEKAMAKEGMAAREMLMEQFHAAALGQQEDFLERVAKRVGDALQGMTDKKAMMREAKEILRDEFALMRQGALDAVLADPKLTAQLEGVGFKVKKWDEVKHLKNAKYLPRLFFEAELGGKTVRIGFDIDHAGIGFAESRTSFVEDLIQSGPRADKKLLKPIFDRQNFTLETARHNRRYLEGVRAEGERFEAAEKAAKGTLSSGKTKAGNVAALRQAAAEGLQNLEDLSDATLRLQQMRARLSMMDDSAAKQELMDSLAELSSILGDTL